MSIHLCNLCYSIEVHSSCDTNDNIVDSITMPNFGNYTFWLKDKFNNYWTRTTTTFGANYLELELQYFPKGMFNEYSGSFEITISEDELTNNPITFQINGVDYDCIVVNFVKATAV